MKIYVYWSELKEDFDFKKNLNNDNAILKFEIKHTEGELARLSIVLSSISILDDKKKWIYLSYFDEYKDISKLIFCGFQMGTPKLSKSGVAEITYFSLPLNYKEKLHTITKKLKEEGPFDDLFFDDKEDPTNFLEARNEIFYWDRLSEGVLLSNFFKGLKTFDLTDGAWDKSLNFKILKSKFERVNVEIQSNWIQSCKGVLDIFSAIARKFSRGIINTLTPELLISLWPKELDKVGSSGTLKRSGYFVVESKLEELSPKFSNDYDIFPTVLPISIKRNNGCLNKRYIFRKWFKGCLVIMWNYVQKRRENVRFSVGMYKNSNIPFNKIKNIKLNLCNVYGSSENNISENSSFFTTKRGHQAIAYAMEIAKCYIAASLRCFEVCVNFDWKNFVDLDLDSSVILRDQNLPGGIIYGKVVEYKFVQDGNITFGWVRVLACLENIISMNKVSRKKERYVESNYVDEFNNIYKTKSGICFEYVHDKKPKEGILNAKNIEDDFIEKIDVFNDGEVQSRILANNQYPVLNDASILLGEHPTTIDIKLKNLCDKTILIHDIEVPVLTNMESVKVGAGS